MVVAWQGLHDSEGSFFLVGAASMKGALGGGKSLMKVVQV